MLLPNLSTSNIRRMSSVVGSIKTRLLSTPTSFVKLTKALIFLRPAILKVIEKLYIDCCNVCPIDYALSQLISLLSFGVKPFAKLSNPELVVSNGKPSNLQSLYYTEMRQALRPAR